MKKAYTQQATKPEKEPKDIGQEFSDICLPVMQFLHRLQTMNGGQPVTIRITPEKAEMLHTGMIGTFNKVEGEDA